MNSEAKRRKEEFSRRLQAIFQENNGDSPALLSAVQDLLGGVVEDYSSVIGDLQREKTALHESMDHHRKVHLQEYREALSQIQTYSEELAAANEELRLSNEELSEINEALNQQNTAVIATQKIAEEERQRYYDLFNSAPEGYLVTDCSGNILEANDTAGLLLAIHKEDLAGRNLIHFLSENGKEEFHTRIARAVSGEHQQNWEVVLQPFRKDAVWVSINIAPVYSEGSLVQSLRWMVRDITERKGIEMELRRKQTELQALFDHSPAGLVLFDASPPYKVLVHNKFYQELFNEPYRSRGMRGLNIYQYAPEVEAAGIVAALEEVVLTKKTLDLLDFPFNSSPPKESWYDWYLSPIIIDDQVVALVSISIDVTDLHNARRAEQEIKEHQKVAEIAQKERQQLFSVLETLPTMVYLLSSDYQITFANRSFRERFGEPEDQPCYACCFGRTEPCEFCETYRVLETGKPHRWEINAPDGSIIDVFDFPFTDVDGTPMILEMGIDITKQRRAEESLRKTSQYVRNLIEASPDPLVTISAKGKITDVNQATLRATGLSREELVGTDFSSYFTEPEKARAGYQQVFAKGHVTDYPLTIRSRDGHLMDVLYNATVYLDADGKVSGVFAAARDVTARNRAEEELAKYRDHLEELVKERTEELKTYALNLKRSNEDLEKFAYVASHDLQEPLRTVVSFSQLLKRQYGDRLGEDADEYIRFIVDAGNRMQDQIHDLLEYSRVSTRGREITRVESEAALKEAIEDVKNQILRSDAKITHEPLPAVLADASQLRQIFQNLLSNAIKFSKEDTVPEIHISAKSLGDRWQFSVRDNGIGIEPEFAERIFVIFQRLHTRDMYPGSGIGLAICKRIVDRHGGAIWMESEPGVGSTFYFTLPAAD